jgi:hypothetical protein
LLVVTVAIVGCGTSERVIPRTYPVNGRVVLGNGAPLTAGRIAFVPRDVLIPPASGSIEADGSFRLTTKVDGDGAAPGEYKVRIEPAETPDAPRRGRRLKFPVKFVDEDSSGILVTVRAETNQLKPIVLK